MAQSPPLSDASTLQPIIKRSLSPSSAVSNSALKSPQFSPTPASPSVHQVAPGAGNQSSYFSQHHSGSIATPMALTGADRGSKEPSTTSGISPTPPPPTPGILLNKHDSTTIRERPNSPPVPHVVPEPLLRVASPAESADSGFSSDGVRSPPPALGSLVQTASPSGAGTKPALDSLVTTDIKRALSPPSPHCHFAPLPKPEERPQSRRSSIVSGRVKPFVPRPPERSDTMSTTGDEEAISPGEYTPSLLPHGQQHSFYSPTSPSSTSEHFSALSQRLSSSLTFAAPTPRHPASPSRPASRRSSSSRRSRSPSPPGLSLRGSDRGDRHSAGSRTHSPNLSRRPSTDALSLHYIEAGAEGSGRGVNLSRQNSRAGSDRGSSASAAGGVFDEAFTLSGVPSGTGIRRPQSTERRSTFDPTTPMNKSLSNSSSTMMSLHNGNGMMMIDRDKEADLHRLIDKAQHGNVDAERAVSPALHAQAVKREREGSVGRSRQGEREEVQVVELGRADDRADAEELEEVQEEEEEGIEEEEEDEDDGDEDEEDEEEGAVPSYPVGLFLPPHMTDGFSYAGNGDSEDEEPDRSREEDDDDDDEEEEEPAEERKTSKGAAVEVVRWHRDDPAPDATRSIAEDAIAEEEAEAETDEQHSPTTPTAHTTH
ncbi:uncharacterized protein JCM15063_000802 [Sporobolomyces koalae]|uniref:uncharacterized protein n=1 Tax=Sporobolomyces koalae TaxID=500713 RepID=UPI0031784399